MSKKFLVDYTEHGLPIVEFDDGTGHKVPRALAALPPRPTCNLPDFPSATTFLPADQWEERSYRHCVDEVLDQGKTSACGGYAVEGCFRTSWIADGREPHRFEPRFPYGLVNGGQDGGSVISDLLEAMIQSGICIRGEIPNGALFKHQFPPKAFKNALRFRIGKAFKCNSFEDIVAAISCGFMTVFGIMVGRNFGNLDSEGVAPTPDVVLGGHALAGVGSKRLKSGEWAVDTLNSWSVGWGDDGFCNLTKKSFARRLDAFAIQAALWDPEEDGPPPAKFNSRAWIGTDDLRAIWKEYPFLRNKSQKRRRK